MGFGPIIGGGGASQGGGGGGLAIVTLTGSVTDVSNDGIGDNFVNLDLALPEGISRCAILGCSITRTDGDSALLSLLAFPNNDRSGTPIYLMGGEFAGVDITGDDTPVYGPRADAFGSTSWNMPVYINLAGAEFIRARVVNNDSESIADVDVTVEILPLG